MADNPLYPLPEFAKNKPHNKIPSIMVTLRGTHVFYPNRHTKTEFSQHQDLLDFAISTYSHILEGQNCEGLNRWFTFQEFAEEMKRVYNNEPAVEPDENTFTFRFPRTTRHEAIIALLGTIALHCAGQ